MARSFRKPYTRVLNFGIEGAIPRPPWWADPDYGKVRPPASPPWSPPPTPRNDRDPFGAPPWMPAPRRPSPDQGEVPGGSDLLDGLFGRHRADPDGSWTPRRSLPTIDGPAEDFLDRRPWRFVQPNRDLVQTLPFDSRQLDALLRLRPEELRTLTQSTPSSGRAVQPPIFFPLE